MKDVSSHCQNRSRCHSRYRNHSLKQQVHRNRNRMRHHRLTYRTDHVALDEQPNDCEVHRHKKRQHRIRKMAQLRNRRKLPSLELDRSKVLELVPVLARNKELALEQLRNRNRQRLRKIRGFHNEPSAC